MNSELLAELIPRPQTARRFQDGAIKIISALAALVGCFFLAWILYVVIERGAGALGWNFFTQITYPEGVAGGGMANAIVGTLVLTALSTLIGVPLGLLTGVYLAEFGRGHKLAYAIHFAANVLMGVPSIIIGVFVYGLMVRGRGYSGYAGATALAIIMIPIVARTTEDILLLVPSHLREAALALGAPRWRVIFGVLFRAAKVGMLTGVLLAIARVSGETAPLIFTAANDQFWTRSLSRPMANLTVTIYERAGSPSDDFVQSAWGASLLITVGVLALTIICRFLIRQRTR